MYKLGIDVGGTTIDFAVVNQSDAFQYGMKELAEGDFQDYFRRGLESLIKQYDFDPRQTVAIHLGTTLAMNSLLERKSLYKVGVIRLASHAPDLPPAYSWPVEYRDSMLAGYASIKGGREYHNKALSTLDLLELVQAVDVLLKQGAESLAIIGVFSPFYKEDELRAREAIRAEFGNIPVTLSYEIGGLGFIERENTTILNASLRRVMNNAFEALQKTLNLFDFQCQCYMTQNNGTLMTLSEASEFPIRTISSGPTNSIIGASRLANDRNAVVVDIGGTSTDIGLIKDGYPLYSLEGGSIGGISCRMLMPEVVSFAIGGGSVVRGYDIGPDSVGSALFKESVLHGGQTLTLYDVGELLKRASSNIAIDRATAEQIMKRYVEKLKLEINNILPYSADIPILLVGGGAALIPDHLLDKQFIRPPHCAVANAYGAALSEVAGQIDCVVNLSDQSEKILQELEDRARSIALDKGAVPGSLRLIEKKLLPLHYMPEPCHRVLMTVSGRLGVSGLPSQVCGE